MLCSGAYVEKKWQKHLGVGLKHSAHRKVWTLWAVSSSVPLLAGHMPFLCTVRLVCWSRKEQEVLWGLVFLPECIKCCLSLALLHHCRRDGRVVNLHRCTAWDSHCGLTDSSPRTVLTCKWRTYCIWIKISHLCILFMVQSGRCNSGWFGRTVRCYKAKHNVTI